MTTSAPLDWLPLWAFFVATVLIVLASIEAGYRLGLYRRKKSLEEKDAPVGAIVAATLGLLGLILAFTFGLAAARFDAKRQVVVEEANAIGTAYLRAGFLPDEQAAEIRGLLRDYVDARLEVVRTGDIEKVLLRSGEMHGKIWQLVEAIGRQDPDSIVVGLFIQSINNTIDIHSKRVLLALQNRLPLVLWLALYFITMMTMTGVGYQEGLMNSSRSLAIVVLVLTFAAIMTLITDLDRPQEGLLTVSQRAMIDLREMMNDHP